ncbi:Signal transduction histidine-protein kinase BarA [Serratia quinivorans]|jgi:two-component system sensor histidine kinase BarA|uniref:two-component sensor histidine kinase BarA n=1 Tax=Serratia TaxID=613 RepID=UPI002177A1F6|nr:two-component sensor histidine kinase BarA [Serratia quinivorans]CAI1822241.1 Signal transduction histidine-protein kinase BarA [Serratia quinivorans]CAI1933985.1 Signal transduction histidine-protein kinase BarA [Serratia quinivorans]CAI2118054.1 Signal transduction histidine-protein kinase BarA [Serratia quinivorans]CAI2121962.1 Signal transduction histidine-protein kinase BarA [Serratia quinivorans]CAI2397397.1 Signal transduction histidine-protein kinase BarA [Serratia quinivorans]
MTKYSLRARMMILILAPTLLIGLLLSTFFVVHRYNELQEQLVDAGASIIEPLAVASEYGMTFRSRESVRQLVSLLHRRHSDIVRSITVFDAQNNLFVTSNYHHNFTQLQLPKGVPIPTDLMLTRRGDSLILRTPILAESQYPDQTASSDPQQDNRLGYVAIELDLQSVRLQQYKEVFVSTLLLLLCMCIAILFAYRLMRDVTGPIRNMVNTVDRIRRGQLDSRVEGFMLGELHMLKNGINSMAMSLTAYHEEMQQNIDQATSDLRETLEQMEIQNVELDLAKKRAQEAARIKSEFLANMSHELRTPLNGVIGFTRQMLKTEMSVTQTDYLQTIERSANNLLTIINDVLDFSKLEAGKLVLEHIPFSLRETLDEVIVLLAPSAHEKGLELTLDVHNDVPEQVIGDSLRLQQIITNLLGNAIKFTETGNIDIRVELRGQQERQMELEVQIHDTGIGISERQQSQLFQAFRQADASISRRHGGTGLGLVITQKLVKEMGGDICFHSQLNRGSTFWFHITLDLHEGMLSLPSNLPDLQGKTLGYIEANPMAAQATLNMLSVTHLVITHSPTLAQLPKKNYDFLLVGVPIPFRENMAQHESKLLAALKIADRVILALPSQSQINAEQLKQQGAAGCLIKPITSNRLFPLLRMETPLRLAAVPEHKRLPLTVMAVDDNPANLKLIGTLLAEQVEKTLLCESGEEALLLARDNVLDLILMDIQMPNIDGIRTSELIRQLPHHNSTPIVAVTAHAVSGEREHLLQAGMDDYLAKPIDEAMLTRVLARYYSGEPEPETAVNQPPLSLDWPLALRQAANKPDLAHDLLQMLLDFLPQVSERVQAILDGTPDDGILDLIHKLHGSCSYSGVPRLKQLCFYLEQQLRQGVSNDELEPEWLELLDEIELVSQAARTHLG